MSEVYDPNQEKQHLKNIIYAEPITAHAKRHLVRYVQVLTDEARKLEPSRLHGSAGHEIAMDICGALAYQSADGVEYDGWFNEADEPLLYEMMNVTGRLDIKANQPEYWTKLFELANDLEKLQ